MGAIQSTPRAVANCSDVTCQSNPELGKLRQEYADLKTRLQAATEHAKQIEVLKDQLAEALQPKPNEELEKLRKEFVDLKTRLQAAEEHAKQIELLKAELSEARQPKSNEELEKLHKESVDLKARLHAATEHAKQIETLKSQLDDARKPNPVLEKLRKESFDLKARLQASTEHGKQVETLKAELDELKSAPPPQPTVDPAMKQRISELEKENSNAEKKMMEVNELVQTLQNENKHLHDREQQISAELEKGCSKVKVLEAEVEKLTQNKNELHELTMSIAEKVRTAENQAEQVLKAHLQAATEHAKQVETLKSQLEDARKLNPELEKLRKECIDLKARLQASTEHAKEVETLKSQLEELKSAPLPQPIVDPVMMQRISELEEQKSIAEKKMMEVNQLVQTLHDQNKQNHYREQQISAELEKDRSRVKVLEAEVEKLTQNKHELNELQSKYDICITTINKMDTLLRKAYAEAIERSKERDELKKTIESLNTTTGTKEVVIENNNSKVKDLEAEVEKLTQKKNELYELTMSLGEKVRTAENQAEQVLKDYEKVSGESYGKAAEVIANSLKSLNIKVSEGIPKTHEEFNKWAQGLPTVLQKVTVEKEFEVKDTVEKEAVRKSSTSRDNGEVKKLKEDVKRYENSIDLLVNQLHAIEAAYAEREAELKAEINALEQTQRN